MKYIDPSKLIEVVDVSRAENPHTDLKIARNHRLEHEHFIRMIVRAPAEDVMPVVHARWLAQVYDPSELPRYRCSNCSEFVQAGDDRNYCPTCGSKMDAEGF